MKRFLLPLIALLGFVATGCGPSLFAVSRPPPTRDAEHENEPFADEVIHVSQGVAIAFDCYDGFFIESCRDAVAKMADPKIAKVYRAHLERKPQPYSMGYVGNARQRAGFVLVGVTKGQTTLRVETDKGVREIVVSVE